MFVPVPLRPNSSMIARYFDPPFSASLVITAIHHRTIFLGFVPRDITHSFHILKNAPEKKMDSRHDKVFKMLNPKKISLDIFVSGRWNPQPTGLCKSAFFFIYCVRRRRTKANPRVYIFEWSSGEL